MKFHARVGEVEDPGYFLLSPRMDGVLLFLADCAAMLPRSQSRLESVWIEPIGNPSDWFTVEPFQPATNI